MKTTDYPKEYIELRSALANLFQDAKTLFGRKENFLRALLLFIAELVANPTKTTARLLIAIGLHQNNPSGFYRFFARLDPIRFLRWMVQQVLCSVKWEDVPPYLLMVVDATHIARTGRKMVGAFWSLCAKTAVFARGLQWMQRFVSFGWLTPLSEHGYRQCVMLGCLAAFSARALRAPAGSRRSEVEAALVGIVAVRAEMDAQGHGDKWLVVLGDGSYDTRQFFQGLPERTIGCVRMRHDARLCWLPAEQEGRGRRRLYGERFTPEQRWRLRHGWDWVEFECRGRKVRCQVRVEGPCRRLEWGERVFFVLIIRGHHGRHKQRPARAYWVSAVLDGSGNWVLPASVVEIVEWLWARWGIEEQHRVLKSGLGIGQKRSWGLASGVGTLVWGYWLCGVLGLAGWRAWGVEGGVRLVSCWWSGSARWQIGDVCRVLGVQVWDAFGGEFGTVCVSEGVSWVEMGSRLVEWLVEGGG